MLRPRVSRRDAKRAFRPRLGVTKVVAQLAGEGRHGEKIRIVGVHRFEAADMRAEPRPHILLAEHVIEELCELGGEEIGRPFGVIASSAAAARRLSLPCQSASA